KIADARLELGFTNSLLVTVPVPEKAEMRQEELEPLLLDALREAKDRQIKGKEITPFLLSRMSEKSNKRTLSANVALLENNAKVAAEI
ncbi:pseudouridine-5'-phosphate glycosidase, partial [Escherichia coli]|nr:pseudouridine-5'-phosphate glycosidase [Escherichia coli]